MPSPTLRYSVLVCLTAYLTASQSTSIADRCSDLSVRLWKVFPDTAVFDWYITMEKKDRMTRCDLTYGENGRSNSTRVLENFLPRHRSFNLHPLQENTSYWVSMICTDIDSALHSSPTIVFTTDISSHTEYSLNDTKASLEAKASPQVMQAEAVLSHPEVASMDFRSKFILSLKPRNKVSPHTILGAGCGLVGLVIMLVTSILVVRKYTRFRAEQDRIWEENQASELVCSPVEVETVSEFYCLDKSGLVPHAHLCPHAQLT